VRVVAGDGEAPGVHVLDGGHPPAHPPLRLPDEADELALPRGEPYLDDQQVRPAEVPPPSSPRTGRRRGG
jgi:hypothetical protein